MPTKIAKNVFVEGMDKDTDPKQVKNTKASDIYNLTLSEDGREGQVATFLGVEVFDSLLSGISTTHSDVRVAGVFEANYKFDGVDKVMALVLAYNTTDNNFYIWAVEQGGTKYTQYTKTLTADEDTILTAAGYHAGCVVHGEGGLRHAYIGVAGIPMMKLPLAIDSTPTTGKGGDVPYTEEEIALIRRGFRGSITGIDVDYGNGGDLLCGTYQFAVRLLNNTDNKYTKWGLLTTPAFIGMEHTTDQENYGGVGFVSDGDITLTMTWEKDYTADSLYSHFQIAVIENIDGEASDNLTVKVLQPESLSAASNTYNYDTNKIAKELVNIDELTVDDAAIRSVVDLKIKNNILIGGNVDYFPLDYDNGDPIVGATTAPLQKELLESDDLTNGKAVGYRNPDNATNYVGHWRDELYRYGVVYEDEYGNFSKPKILDFSAVTENWSTVAKGGEGGKDFRFPPRADGKYGTLLNGSGNIQALGLAIKGLDNHPTWAVAAHIVRVPRKKKILFQTPLIPSILVQPAKAQGDYPDQRSSNDEPDLETLNVEAANPEGTFIPKNYYHVLPKNMVRMGDLYGGTAATGYVYATHANATAPMSYLGFFVYSEDNGGNYDVLPSDSERRLYTVNSSTEHLEIRKQIDGDDDPAGEVFGGETGTFRLYRRGKGTSGTWGTAVETEVIPSGTYVDFGGYTLDLTTYDYLVELEDI